MLTFKLFNIRLTKYFLAINIIGYLCLFFLGSCDTSLKKEKLIIKGSNTMGDHLLPELVRAFFEHRGINIPSKDTKDITGMFNDTIYEIKIELGGSQKGLSALADTVQNMIGMVSEDQFLKDQKLGDTLHLGKDSLIIVVHRHNPLTTLNFEQVRNIFTGKIQNWSILTPSYEGSIHVHTRDSMSGTHLFFVNHFLVNVPLSKNAKKHQSNQDLLEDIRRDFGGIGYLSAAEWTPSEDFKAVPIKDASIYRNLHLVYRKEKISDFANSFLDFCRTPQAQDIIKALNFKL